MNSIYFLFMWLLSLLPWFLIGYGVYKLFEHGPRWYAQYKAYAQREMDKARTGQDPTNPKTGE